MDAILQYKFLRARLVLADGEQFRRENRSSLLHRVRPLAEIPGRLPFLKAGNEAASLPEQLQRRVVLEEGADKRCPASFVQTVPQGCIEAFI